MPIAAQVDVLSHLEGGLANCMASDRARLCASLEDLRAAPAHGREDRIAQLAAAIERSQARCAQRVARLPPISYPADLPIVAKREEIAAAIAAKISPQARSVRDRGMNPGKACELPRRGAAYRAPVPKRDAASDSFKILRKPQ